VANNFFHEGYDQIKTPKRVRAREGLQNNKEKAHEMGQRGGGRGFRTRNYYIIFKRGLKDLNARSAARNLIIPLAKKAAKSRQQKGDAAISLQVGVKSGKSNYW